MSEEMSNDDYSPSLPNLLIHAALRPGWTARAFGHSPEVIRSSWLLVLFACLATLVGEFLETSYATSLGAMMESDELFSPTLDVLYTPVFLVMIFLLFRLLWYWPFGYGSGFHSRQNTAVAGLYVGVDAILAPLFTAINLVLMWIFVRGAPAPAEVYDRLSWVEVCFGIAITLFYGTNFFAGTWKIGTARAFLTITASTALCLFLILAFLVILMFGYALISELMNEPI